MSADGTPAELSLREADRRHYLHPYTDHASMHTRGTHVVRRAEGVWIEDDDGHRVLDGLAGLWCVNVGYGCERIVRAVTQQMQTLPFYPSFFESATEPAIRLAERLAALSPPSVNAAFFSGSGSEANETALKIIRAHQKLRGRSEKRKILSRSYAYHGVTLATSSLTGLPPCRDPFDLPLPGFVQVPGPYARGAGADDAEEYADFCIAETRRIIEAEDPDTIAAIFVEPVQGAGGVIVPPEGHLAALRALAREYDILFVADEVITGFGRLGEWFASGLWDLEPDLLTLAKGVTSGYVPMGATLVSDEIAESLRSGGLFSHGHTYSGHPTAAAAALANLDEIQERGLLPHVRETAGPRFQAAVASLAEHPLVVETRGVGLIGAVDLVLEGEHPPLGPLLSAWIREEGAMVRGIRDGLAFSPPLPIDEAEIDHLFGCVRRALDRLLAKGIQENDT